MRLIKMGNTWVWLGGMPEYLEKYPATEHFEEIFEAKPAQVGDIRQAACRILNQSGAERFGFVGGTFEPDMSTSLILRVAIPDDPDYHPLRPSSKIELSESRRLSDLNYGMHLGRCILAAAKDVLLGGDWLEAGTLTIEHGYFHMVDTLPWHVIQVTLMLVHLMSKRWYLASDDDLLELRNSNLMDYKRARKLEPPFIRHFGSQNPE